MDTNPKTPANEIEANTQSGITRRTFIKRTAATAVAASLALHCFRNEARAEGGGSGSDVLISKTFDYSGGEDGFATRSSAVSAYARAVLAGKIPKITEQKGPKEPLI